MTRECNINGYVNSIGYALNFSLYNYRDPITRRASHTKTSDGGVDQDWGINEFDRVISGYVLLSESELTTIQSMHEHSTGYVWKFSNGETLWNVVFARCDLEEKIGTKFRVELRFNCRAKVQ